MRTSGAIKYRNFEVVRGGLSPLRGRRRGRRMRTAAEIVLDHELRTAFVAIEGRAGTVPSEGIQKIREGEQHPWRVLARRLVEAHAAGASHAQVRRVAVALVGWVDRLYDVTGETVREFVLYQPARVA